MVNSTEIRVYMTRENENNKSLAEKVGISSATLGRWLEKQDMPVSYAEKIAVALLPAATPEQALAALRRV